MSHSHSTLKTILAVAAVACMATACTPSWNRGGDTTCGTFMGLSIEQRSQVIRTFYKDEVGQEPSDLTVAAARTAAQVYCAIGATANDPIRGPILSR